MAKKAFKGVTSVPVRPLTIKLYRSQPITTMVMIEATSNTPPRPRAPKSRQAKGPQTQ